LENASPTESRKLRADVIPKLEIAEGGERRYR
jgi:hypothetical protein